MPERLPPGQFFAFSGYLPKKGAKHVVRYGSFGKTPLESNEGEGLVSMEDVLDASRDSLVRALIPRKIRESLEVAGARRREGKVGWYTTAAAIRLLQVMKKNEAALEWVRDLKNMLDREPTSMEVDEARSAAKEVLGFHWPATVDPNSLLKRCIAAASLEGVNSGKRGTLETEPKLLWGILAEIYGHNGPPPWQPVSGNEVEPAKLKPVWMAGAKMVLEGKDYLVYEAADVLENAAIADQIITTKQFEEWLVHSNATMQRVAAAALARRGQTDRLAKLGDTLDPAGQILALVALAYGGHSQSGYPAGIHCRGGPGSLNEEAFWRMCMLKYPLESTEALWSADFDFNRNRFNGVVHDPLHDYLAKEAEKAAQITAPYDLGPDGQKLYLAVRMLGSWLMSEDIPVLKLLLRHPGTMGQNGPVIQRAAKDALFRQGVSVPDK